MFRPLVIIKNKWTEISLTTEGNPGKKTGSAAFYFQSSKLEGWNNNPCNFTRRATLCFRSIPLAATHSVFLKIGDFCLSCFLFFTSCCTGQIGKTGSQTQKHNKTKQKKESGQLSK